MDLYKSAVRPALFALDAERAHRLGKAALRSGRLWGRLTAGRAPTDGRLAVDLGGLRLAGPVGVAAGFDKDAEVVDGVAGLGFGYHVTGSIRVAPNPDNPSPILVRDVERQSLVNCTGNPSKGARYVAGRLAAFRRRHPDTDFRVIPNIVGATYEEYVAVFAAVQPYADAVEVTLVCPNEPYAMDFLDEDTFRGLMERLNERRQRPLFVKIRNHANERERENRFRLVDLCVEYGVDAITMAGSRVVDEPRLSLGRGNMSGKAVFDVALRNVRDIYEATGGKVAIKAVGGVFTAEDAFEAITCGASSVEMVSGLVYEGWSVAARINAGLLRLLEEHGIPSLRDLRGHANTTGWATGLRFS